MSADPKSLAVLAIATANKKKANQQQQQQQDGGQPEKKPHSDIEPIHKFRSTDEFVAGWTAAFVNTTVLFPVNKLIFRQMADGHKTLTAAGRMRKEGRRYLYRGILPPLIQKMVSVSIMFGSFGHYKKWVDRKFTSSHPLANLALAACLTGATEAVLTPLERVQMLLQDRNYHKDYKNTIDTLIRLKKFGSVEYYRGFTCVLVRNGPSNILFFGLRDKIKKLMQNFNNNNKPKELDNKTKSSRGPFNQEHENNNPNFRTLNYTGNTSSVRPDNSMIYDFLSGAILGMCISTAFYPLSVVRTRMQTRAPGTEFLSMSQAFMQVYNERDRKFSRFFHGCLINVLRQFVSWGIINCSYEFVLDALRNRR